VIRSRLQLAGLPLQDLWGLSIRHLAAALLLVLLTSCGAPKPSTTPTATSTPEETSLPHASEIRFALIGDVTNANVWALFDASGYSYNNYAVRSGYWPRLYGLSIPARQFEEATADAMPSPIQPEGNFYTATIPLRSDLTWTDGSPLNADDVVFTVNTVLSFQLGFDWHDYYNPDWLDHAEAIDAHTVKFYFRKVPNVGVWQYGALQGPIVQKAYWAPKVADSVALLPSADLRLNIETLKVKVADLQKRVDSISATIALPSTTGAEARQLQASFIHQQGDLSKAINDLAKAQSDLDTAMNAAHTALYALKDQNEPHLGTWDHSIPGNGVIQNESDPKFPLAHPNMDRAIYRTYPSEETALAAFLNDEVDAILTPGGLSSQSLDGNPSLQALMKSPSHGLEFLVINPLSPGLSDPAIHQALACVIDQEQLATHLNGQALPLEAYVLADESGWNNADASLPCKGSDTAARIEQAVQILKSAGYKWRQVPAADAAGQKLTLPNGQAFPNINLLTPASDDVRSAAASYIQHQARMLGIPLTAQSTSPDELNYSVLSSYRYDLALLGWHVSSYPNYLCDWFGNGNPFHYDDSQIKPMCEALNMTNDLAAARQQVFNIQSLLARDLPFIPLYSGVTFDAFHNVTYPFDQVPDGLSGVYGAPSLAIPARK
jgi:peptide/nickel transport system substrate-binding protein